jgi:N-acetylglucosamine-6-phosphate deacetylase
MSDLLFANARVVGPNGLWPGALAVTGGRIEACIALGDTVPSAGRVIDLEGAYLAPGFIDLHIHGAAGADVLTANESELDAFSEWLAQRGVTRLVPTLVPVPLPEYRAAVVRLSAWIERARSGAAPGAVPVGIHFEGPFVNAARCGALHRPHFLGAGQRSAFFEAIDAGRAATSIRVVTIAPEIEGGLDLIRDAVQRGFVVSIGHTEASLAQLDEALAAGARHMTHLANAMPAIHHRDPGPIVWGLVRSDVTVDVIADLRHLHPEMLRLVFNAKGARGVALISDAIAPAGLGDGTFSVWGEEIRVAGGTTSNAAGTIAGSVISLADAVANMVGLGLPIADAVRMASAVPARVLGLHGLGEIAEGNIADLVAFGDDLVPRLTVVAGKCVGGD